MGRRGAKKAAAPSAQALAVAAAYAALPATLEALAPFACFKRMAAHLRFASGADLSGAQLAWVMATLRSNMEPVFGAAAWPAQERSRRCDAVACEARYLLVLTDHADCQPEQSPLGFAHYRFVEEEGVAVLYVYELQVSEAARGRGLGRYLMFFLELIAKRSDGLGGVMLTIQRANPRALDFYGKCGYTEDAISPSRSDPFAEDGEYDYHIFSKLQTAAARETLRLKGEEARLQNAAAA